MQIGEIFADLHGRWNDMHGGFRAGEGTGVPTAHHPFHCSRA